MIDIDPHAASRLALHKINIAIATRLKAQEEKARLSKEIQERRERHLVELVEFFDKYFAPLQGKLLYRELPAHFTVEIGNDRNRIHIYFSTSAYQRISLATIVLIAPLASQKGTWRYGAEIHPANYKEGYSLEQILSYFLQVFPDVFHTAEAKQLTEETILL